MELKPIPAFYCCYLLRSTVRHASVYVGSSPDPARRLAQHNGRVQGGAVRTSRASLRPWEMACVVAGFPSNIAALQFEWAWHNAHLTRHITPTERITFATARTKTSKTGKTTRRPGRPRTSLMDKLSNLHLLLRAPYFSKWPLEVRFFSEAAYRSWITWCGRVDTHLRAGIKVSFDPAQTQPPAAAGEEEFTSAQPVQRKRKADLIGKGGVQGVDPTYARLRHVFEKSRFLLDEGDDQKCSVCEGALDLRRDLFVICHTEDCHTMSHVTCLADRSLKHHDESDLLVPSTGLCLSCGQNHPWTELMQQVTLRTRGVKEVQKLLGNKGNTTAAAAAEILETESEEENDLDDGELTAQEVVDEDVDEEAEGGFDDEQDDENVSVASADSFTSRTSNVADTATRTAAGPARLEIVIEDSEDDR
jgi:structure-specific endonuclease subunit SLX1